MTLFSSKFILKFSGTINIGEVENLVKVYFSGNNGEFMAELSVMLDKDTLAERRKQIDLCSHLDQYHEGARVVMDLKTKFNITGNFDDLKRILDSVSVVLFYVESSLFIHRTNRTGPQLQLLLKSHLFSWAFQHPS